MTATINETLVLQSVNQTGFVDMIITGTESIYNGQHLTYYVRLPPFSCSPPPPYVARKLICGLQEQALSKNAFNLEMNVLQIVKDSSSS